MDIRKKNPFQTDRILVEKLWEGNDEAWKYVLGCTVIPMLREEHYYRIVNDRQLSELDVLGMLFEVLIVRKKLALFQFKCPFFLWARHYVTKEIHRFCKKNPQPVSDDTLSGVLSGGNVQESTEKLTIAEKCFRKLWRQSPQRAYVHLLMVQNNMSAREIMNLLSISSEENVYQMHSRAISEIRNIRSEMTGEDSL